ncbi:hypothetical protein [Peribacillus muralis]|uniref:hypothetical protein n=1 Tax=Peribacillus muralis TaxID=264697 RepID=UPI00366CB29A
MHEHKRIKLFIPDFLTLGFLFFIDRRYRYDFCNGIAFTVRNAEVISYPREFNSNLDTKNQAFTHVHGKTHIP